MIGPALQTFERRKWILALVVPVLIYNCLCSYLVGKRFNDDARLKAQLWMVKMSRQQRCRIKWHLSTLVATAEFRCPRNSSLAEQTRPYHQHETSSTCVCLICRGRVELFSKVFPDGCNPSLRKEDILTRTIHRRT